MTQTILHWEVQHPVTRQQQCFRTDVTFRQFTWTWSNISPGNLNPQLFCHNYFSFFFLFASHTQSACISLTLLHFHSTRLLCFHPLRPDNSWTSGPRGIAALPYQKPLTTRMQPRGGFVSSLWDSAAAFHDVSNRRVGKHTWTNCKVRWILLVFEPLRSSWRFSFSSPLQPFLSNECVRWCQKKAISTHSRIRQSLKSAIFGDREHTPSHLTRWHQLYPQCCSSRPRKCHQYPCNCAPMLRSWCSRCGRTYRRSR